MKCFYKACPKHADETDECTNKANVCTASSKETTMFKLASVRAKIPKPSIQEKKSKVQQLKWEMERGH